MADGMPKICRDMILPEELQTRKKRIEEPPPGLDGGSAMRMAIPLDKPWEAGRTLTVSFLDGDPGVQEKVAEVARQWCNFANILFDFGNYPEADLRISFEYDGSWSYLGKDALRRPLDQPTMNFGWLTPNSVDDEYNRVVIHEFGHALGAIHEHQNPAVSIPWDKEKVYAYYAGSPNFWDKDTVDVNLFKAYDAERTNHSEFDQDSIMLYPVPNQHTVGDYEIGWNREMSQGDQEFIAKQYPSDVKSPNQLVVDGEPVEEAIGEHGEEDTFGFTIEQPGEYVVETHGRADLVMALFGPNNRDARVAEDDDSGRAYNARIAEKLDPGEYSLRVWHYWPKLTTGNYQVTLTKS